MALSDMELANRALVKIGANPIHDFEEPTSEAKIAKMLYGSCKDALLSAYPWSFATAQRSLLRYLGRPIVDYEYAFQLPHDFLRALSAGTSGKGRGLDYRILEKRLHCDCDHVTLSYIFRPKSQNFPPFFDQALIARLAGEFCIPVMESVSRAEVLLRFANDVFNRARQIDATQDSPNRFDDFTLVEVRK